MTLTALSSRRLLPLEGSAGLLPLGLVILLAAYAAALGGTGLIALGDVARDWRQALGSGLTLQLPPDTSPARLEVAMALLRRTPGVTTAQPLKSSETARLLEPWLGKSVPVDIMPLPQLVDIRINAAAAPDLTGLETRLHGVAPEAQLEDHRAWVVRLLGFSSRIRILAIALIAGTCAIAVLVAGIAVSGSLSRRDERIALLHALGADDRAIAGAFVIPAGAAGLLGGAIAVLAAAATIRALAGAVWTLGVPWDLPSLGDRRVLLLLAGAALAGGVIAVSAAALACWRHLSRLP